MTLARNISGLGLPPSIYQDNTFEPVEESAKEVERAAYLLASDLREAVVASLKVKDSSEDDEDDDEDDED